MLEYIRERLPEADDYTLEQIYDFLQEVEYWKEVIRYLIHMEGRDCLIVNKEKK